MARTKERVKLSPSKIDDMKAREAPYRVYDVTVPQLFVRIWPSGIKAFYVAYGRNRDVALGKYPGMTVEAARTQAREALAQAVDGTPEVAKRRIKVLTLRDFLDVKDEDSYATWVKAHRKSGEATVRRIETVFAELLDKPLSGLNAWLIEKWRTKRTKAGIKAATSNRDLVALKAALSKAVEWKVLDRHPLEEVKAAKVENDERVRFLSGDEEARLREALAERDREAIEARRRANRWRIEREHDPLPDLPDDGFADHLTPFVLLSLNCGTRRGELTGLTWANVDLAARRLTVRAATSKGAKTRHIPLNDEAADVLARWHRQCGGERVFDFGSIKTAWKALMARAEIEDFRPHDMRHHFASRLVQSDVSLYHVQKLLGHGSLRMTERYSHVKESDLAAAVARLASG